MTDGLWKLTAGEALAQLRSGAITPLDLADSCLGRISRRESAVGAWQYVDADAVREQAAALASQPRELPLYGIPVGIKDIIDTRDMPTECGSAVFRGRRPAADAESVARLRAAGAVIMGKTVTTEFAWFAPGRTANPRDTARTPGGSSSGSAAAVADGHVPLALGTQTAGSIIRPASYCGVIGYKPSFGDFPYQGIAELAVELDTLGGFARSFGDVALLREVLSVGGANALNRTDAPRAAFLRTGVWDQADADAHRVLEGAVAELDANQVAVSEHPLPPIFDRLLQLQIDLMAIGAWRSLGPLWREQRDLLKPRSVEVIGASAEVGSDAIGDLDEVLQACRGHLDDLFADVDVLLTPAAPGVAPMGLEATGDPIFNRIWTLLGLPCVAFTCGFGEAGMPIAIQAVGRPAGDDELLADAAALQNILRVEVGFASDSD